MLSDPRSSIQGDWYYREAGRRVSYGFHGHLCLVNELSRGSYKLVQSGPHLLLVMPEEEVILVDVNDERMIWEKEHRRYVLTRS